MILTASIRRLFDTSGYGFLQYIEKRFYTPATLENTAEQEGIVDTIAPLP